MQLDADKRCLVQNKTPKCSSIILSSSKLLGKYFKTKIFPKYMTLAKAVCIRHILIGPSEETRELWLELKVTVLLMMTRYDPEAMF